MVNQSTPVVNLSQASDNGNTSATNNAIIEIDDPKGEEKGTEKMEKEKRREKLQRFGLNLTLLNYKMVPKKSSAITVLLNLHIKALVQLAI